MEPLKVFKYPWLGNTSLEHDKSEKKSYGFYEKLQYS